MRIKQIYLRDRSCAWLQKWIELEIAWSTILKWSSTTRLQITSFDLQYQVFCMWVTCRWPVHCFPRGNTRVLNCRGKWQNRDLSTCTKHVTEVQSHFGQTASPKVFAFDVCTSFVHVFRCKELRFQMIDVRQACQSHITVEAFKFRFPFFWKARKRSNPVI